MLPDNILFSSSPANDLSVFISKKKYSKLAVLVDENTRKHCYPIVQENLPEHFLIEVASGETQKNLDTCITIWQALTDHALDRHSALLVLGGGVLGDMGGFCAATYKRGIDFMLVPTTLLAQVDASIGGKLGIDFNHFKNHIGVFQQPAMTMVCDIFLKTLPAAELRSGFAEVIKHCLISDLAMWKQVRSKSLVHQDWRVLVRHSVEFKAYVTTEDPTEKGLRKILNAGHTIGHAVESYLLASNQRILHGEAIAIGLIAENFIAQKRGLLSEQDFNDVTAYILQVFGKVALQKNEIEAAAKLVLQDKKNKGNKILCVLLKGIGSAQWDDEISLDEMKEALSFYQSLQT